MSPKKDEMRLLISRLQHELEERNQIITSSNETIKSLNFEITKMKAEMAQLAIQSQDAALSRISTESPAISNENPTPLGSQNKISQKEKSFCLLYKFYINFNNIFKLFIKGYILKIYLIKIL